MSKSDRHKNRRDQIRGRENKKTKGPEIEVPKAIVQEAVAALKKGQTILYPTDTIYGIGCDATNYEAVEKIYEIKERDPSKSLLILVDSFPMLDQYIEEVPEMAWEVLKVNKDPLTIIYDRPKSVAENLIASDNSLAIRVTNDPLCRAIIRGLRKPIVSTSANISGQPSPVHFEDISEELKERIDHIVDLPLPAKNVKPSAIMKISNNGVIKVIRK
ncbi:L-threonylcarbamoyladenylate synthase [Nonlabens agnitus]|uniref:L-threonylcarbamoyladenylate synthase n=1 Tax=Nonlabens agnitus TaxID=870484 RepID=UPI000D047067|nr:L-threonylcarbamoyladenylate synthase [Nonlabens agnitus]